MARRLNTPTAAQQGLARSVAVIGLGRFGRALATELMLSGAEVLGIDADEDIVQSLNGELTHVVRADSTKQAALDQLGIADFDRVVIGIGSDIQASILTASLLKRMEHPHIWAKAISEQHGLILEQLGIPHVVYPESDMGRRIAHLVRGKIQDFVPLDARTAIAKTHAPSEVVGRPLGQLDIPQRHHVTIVARKDAAGEWAPATADTVLGEGAVVLVLGAIERTERFCALPGSSPVELQRR